MNDRLDQWVQAQWPAISNKLGAAIKEPKGAELSSMIASSTADADLARHISLSWKADSIAPAESQLVGRGLSAAVDPIFELTARKKLDIADLPNVTEGELTRLASWATSLRVHEKRWVLHRISQGCVRHGDLREQALSEIAADKLRVVGSSLAKKQCESRGIQFFEAGAELLPYDAVAIAFPVTLTVSRLEDLTLGWERIAMQQLHIVLTERLKLNGFGGAEQPDVRLYTGLDLPAAPPVIARGGP